MTDPSKFGVNSYHMNVGQGDGAVHILYEEKGTKWHILKAVLIDGGSTRTGKSYLDLFSTVKQELEQTYEIDGNTLKFDSIVITHWDADHYQGLLNIIGRDLAASGSTTRQCSFMKYDATSKDPQTLLYVPFWEKKGQKSATGKKKYYPTNDEQSSISWAWEKSDSGEVKITLGNDAYEKVCRVSCDDGMLGANIFTNTKLPSSFTPDSIDSPESLVAAHTSTGAGVQPAMYCISRDRRRLGNKGTVPYKEIFLGDIDDSISSFNDKREYIGGVPYIIKETPTDANASSISAMIIWPQTKNISHYFAGDLDMEMEDQIVAWTQQKAPHTVSALKASHHGAATSSPQSFMEKWKPNRIIFSAGKSSYFHPRWEILLWLWLAGWANTSSTGTRSIFATCYPYWLTKNKAKEFVYAKDLKNVFKGMEDNKYAAYRDLLKSFYATITPPLQDIIEGYENASDKTTYLAQKCEDVWEALAETPKEAVYRPQGQDKDGGPIIDADRVLYILVTSRADPDHDGEAHWKTLKSPVGWSEPNKVIALKRKAPTPTPSPTAAKVPCLAAVPIDGAGTSGSSGFGSDFMSPPFSQAPTDDPSSQNKSLSTLDTESGFFYYAVDVGVGDFHVVEAAEQKSFLTYLHRQVLGLVNKLPEDDGSASVLSTDEMYAWFTHTFGATAMIARGKDPDISHFDLTVPFTTASTPSLNMEFSTEAIPLQFDLLPTSTSLAAGGAWGLLAAYPVNIFGLRTSVTANIEDIFELAAVEFPVLLPKGLQVKIDEPQKENDGSLHLRNALWFLPSENYRTVLRMQLYFVDYVSLNQTLQNYLGSSFSIKSADVIMKKTATWTVLGTEGPASNMMSDVYLVLSANIGNIDVTTAVLFFDDGRYQFVLKFTNGSNVGDVLDWLGDLVSFPLDFNTWLDSSVGTSPILQRIQINVANDKIVGFTVDLEIALSIGKDGTGTAAPVIIFLTYSWPANKLVGTLWQNPVARSLEDILRPDFETFKQLKPQTPPPLADNISLATLDPTGTIKDWPNELVPYVQAATVEIDKNSISFEGILAWESNSSATVPMVNLEELGLRARYVWDPAPSSFELGLQIRVGLAPPETKPQYPKASLLGGISYADNGWTFTASVLDLNVALLYDFFDNDSKDGAIDMLEALYIQNIDLSCTYRNGSRESINFSGLALVGRLQAAVTYNYDLDGWSFDVKINDVGQEATIGEIVQSIIGDAFTLPLCVSNIDLTVPSDEDLFSINVTRVKDKDLLLFHGQFQVGQLGFTFIQMKKQAWTYPKRLIRVSVDMTTWPTGEVPLVGKIGSPFDDLIFLWFDDDNNNPGLTREEVALINDQAFNGNSAILFKEPKLNGQTDTDVVILPGSHFMISLKLNGVLSVVLDHRFGSTKSSDVSPPGGGVMVLASAESSGEGDVTMAPMQKKLGPLSISNIGLQYKNDILSVVLDATFELGPMTLSLLGFSLGVDFQGGFNIQNLPTSLVINLKGLAVGFDKPPLTMAGLFEKTSPTMFAGGITVGFSPYLFLAAGFYGTVGTTKTVFVFAKLMGPLVELEFAEISGICGGFGYNNSIQKPTISQVESFPFIGSNLPSQDPTQVLSALVKSGGWVKSPVDGTFWFCAGLDIKAFRVLSIEAVVVVEFNPYVNLGLYAICQASMPPESPPEKSFMFVELGILISVDFQAGIMKVQAQLSPNSFILAPSCHLTGGFALFYWFGESEYAGDWVFTIGGYHPAYTPLPHYPTCPRLGISWNFDNSLSISGESYFAITPKCCMAGGALHAALSLGPLGAYFDAWANFLVNYNPFYFKGDVGVTVGVRFTLDLWIFTIKISVEIGAQLYLSGPPVQGRVHVNFWVFGFDINFGPSPSQPKAATLDEFWNMLLQANLLATRRAKRRMLAGATLSSSSDHDLVFACEGGMIPTAKEEDSQTPWKVRAGQFVFRVQTRFALNEGRVAQSDGSVATPDNNNSIYAKPMRLTDPLTSKMNISITFDEPTGPTVMDIEEDKWRVEGVMKAVPLAIWGKYNQSEDPTSGNNNIKDLLNAKGATTNLMMATRVIAPRPVLAKDQIPKFNAIHAMSMDVYDKGENPDFVKFSDANTAWAPEEADSDIPSQYSKVKDKWENPGWAGSAKKTLDAWRAAFKWDEEAKCSADPPKLALENFGDYYMEPPRTCPVVA